MGQRGVPEGVGLAAAVADQSGHRDLLSIGIDRRRSLADCEVYIAYVPDEPSFLQAVSKLAGNHQGLFVECRCLCNVSSGEHRVAQIAEGARFATAVSLFPHNRQVLLEEGNRSFITGRGIKQTQIANSVRLCTPVGKTSCHGTMPFKIFSCQTDIAN